MAKTQECPKCGAPLSILSEEIRAVKCEYCDTVIQLDNYQNISRIGKYIPKKTGTGPLKVGMQGRFRGKAFKIIGLLEYTEDGDSWWEYLVSFEDGRIAWISYDDGYWSILFKEKIKSEIPKHPRVGSKIRINDMAVIVEEVGSARITNIVGQIPFTVDADEEIGYIDGYTPDDTLVSVEYTEDEIELFVGYEVSRKELGI